MFDSGVQAEGGDERAFLQTRLAFLGTIGAALGLGVYLVITVAALLTGPPLADLWFPVGAVLQVLPTVGMGLVAWSCRKFVISHSVLHGMDATLTLGIYAFSCLAPFLYPPMGHPEYGVVLSYTALSFLRALLLPSTAQRTLVLALLGGAATFISARELASVTQASVNQAIFGVTLMIWLGLAAVISSMASKVLYGLRARARRAQEMGQYRILDKIGEGSMGVVYRAQHALLRRQTALKVLHAGDADQSAVERFEREVQRTSQLSHQNTVSIYDYGRTTDGDFYYAMELLDGLTLQHLVDNYGPQPAGRVIHMLTQALAALSEAHAQQIVHRDIKPANLMLTVRGGVPDVLKVVDFGLIKELGPGSGDRSLGMVIGTPRYMAPEQVRADGDIDHRADLYAIGAVGYFLLTGQDAFQSSTFADLIYQQVMVNPVPPSRLVQEPIPSDLEQCILQCLSKDPNQRPRNAAELSRMLQGCRDVAAWTEEDARGFWTQIEAEIGLPVVDPLARTVAYGS